MIYTPGEHKPFILDLAQAYGCVDGNPMGVAQAHKNMQSVDELRDFLLTLIEVRLRYATGNDKEVAHTVAEALENTLCHLLSYLRDYHLAQLQASDRALHSPYQASLCQFGQEE